MDPLSDVLRAVRLDGAFFYRVEAGPPWSTYATGARDLLPQVLPAAEHLIPYHILLSGSCWAGLEGRPPVRMEAGDVVVFPHGDAHLMSSGRDLNIAITYPDEGPRRYPETVMLGPDGERDTTLVCGFLGCDVRPYNPLLNALPECIHVSGIADGWLGQFPRQVVEESRAGRAGSETMLTRMAELMFIEVVRTHLMTIPEEQHGWLAGLRDPVVGPALSKIHEEPSRDWSLPDLARATRSSRSVLAERFTAIVGLPPMQYLTRWRLQLAAELLARGSSKIASVAAAVGYESEAAFSRAFKRETGTSPAIWRQTRLARS
jgi:AraC-like DNA-binding protein